MNDKGDIYYRDIHGNFHKLSTQHISNELDDFLEFDNIINSEKFEHQICDKKPLNYYSLILKKIRGTDILDNKIFLKKGLYRFFIFTTLTSSENQRIYSFLRSEKIFEPSLKTYPVFKNIPNNVSYNFVFNIKADMYFKLSILSEKTISNISSYVMYVKIN